MFSERTLGGARIHGNVRMSLMLLGARLLVPSN
jgi:hypothetical protein